MRKKGRGLSKITKHFLAVFWNEVIASSPCSNIYDFLLSKDGTAASKKHLGLSTDLLKWGHCELTCHWKLIYAKYFLRVREAIPLRLETVSPTATFIPRLRGTGPQRRLLSPQNSFRNARNTKGHRRGLPRRRRQLHYRSRYFTDVASQWQLP